MSKTKLLKYGYPMKEALLLLLRTDPSLDLHDAEEVYYPYVRFRYKITVGTGRIVKKANKLSDCIIDRVSGSVYETNGEPEYEEVELNEDDTISIATTMEECYKIGHDFTLKLFIGKSKLLMSPEMEIIEEEQFYKKFYVVKCLDIDQKEYFIMIDAVDGGISVLDHEKYYKENPITKKEL